MAGARKDIHNRPVEVFSVSQVHNVSWQYYYLFKFCGLIHRYIVLYFLPKKSFLLPTYYEIRGLVGSQNGANIHSSVQTSLQDPAINLYTSVVDLIYFRRLHVGIAWIFLKSKFISKSKKIQFNPRLDNLDYSERTWKY